MLIPSPIARLSVMFENVEPLVLRRIEVPLSIRLDRLHAVLQTAIGWTNSHLWELRAGGVRWGIPDLDHDSDRRDGSKVTLVDVLEGTGTSALTYLYDFGDGWEHTILVELVTDAGPTARYPRLIGAIGRCPPEDVGGPAGYAEFLAAIADPDHERHEELTEWHGAKFDPVVVETDVIERRLAALGRGWSSRARPAKRASG